MYLHTSFAFDYIPLNSLVKRALLGERNDLIEDDTVFMEASHQPLMPAIDPLPSHTHIWSIMCYYPGFDNPRSIILRGSLRELLDIFTISQEYKGEFVQ